MSGPSGKTGDSSDSPLHLAAAYTGHPYRELGGRNDARAAETTARHRGLRQVWMEEGKDLIALGKDQRAQYSLETPRKGLGRTKHRGVFLGSPTSKLIMASFSLHAEALLPEE